VTEAQGDAGRGRVVALVVAGVVAAALVGVAIVTAGGSGASGQGLRIERGAAGGGGADLVVYVDDTAANVPETAGGKTTVELQCLDRSHKVVVTATHPWPFGETDDGLTGPHVHQRTTSQQADRIARCRLDGTDPALEGRLGAAR
jgi:hypothetical protein